MQQKSSGTLKRILGIAAFLFACLVIVGVLYAIIFLPLRLNAGLVQGLEIVKTDPAVAETFGTPIRESPIVMGTTKEFRYGDGQGSLTAFISGPKGKGDLAVFITRPEGSDWLLKSMSITVGGKTVLVWDADEAEAGFRYRNPPPGGSNIPTPSPAPTPSN